MSFAQSTLTIGIVKDADTKEFNEFSTMLQKEISDLVGTVKEVHFKELAANWDTTTINANISKFMTDPGTDYVIALGYLSSRQLTKLKNYSKPAIAATIFDDRMLNMPRNSDNTTGVNNFTYIESIINLKNNLKEYSRIFCTKDISVIAPDVLTNNFPELKEYLNQNKTGFNISLVSVGKNCDAALDLISPILMGIVCVVTPKDIKTVPMTKPTRRDRILLLCNTYLVNEMSED